MEDSETKLVAKEVLDYIRERNVMTLATHGSEGLWAAAVFYVNDGFTFYFLSAESTRHVINMKCSPQVSATIQLDYDNWKDIKGVQMEGQVVSLGKQEKISAITRYGIKFPVVGNAMKSPAEIKKAMTKVSWYKLVPDRLFFINNAKGLGHRDEVDLQQ